MQIRFSKMHGLGNDFVVIDGIRQSVTLGPGQVRRLAHRRLGVGCDQVLLVQGGDSDDVDFRYRIFNADGNEVEQCGNGARCFARFVLDEGLTDKRLIPVATGGGLITLQVEDDGQVTVDMGAPRLHPDDLPFRADATAPSYTLAVAGTPYEIGAVSMGNPHAVMQVESLQSAPVSRLGPMIESHERFPNRVNVGFMQTYSPSHIGLRVYERGVGETMACGTGACAAVVSGQIQGLLEETVAVDLPGGRLMITWAGNDHPVLMTGPAVHVFRGTIDL